MLKETIEIGREVERIQGYTPVLGGSVTSATALQELIKFAKDKDIKIYSHNLRIEFEVKPEYGTYDEVKPYKTPMGDRVYCLDIYYQ